MAANVSYAIKQLVKEFNKTYPNTKVRVTLGGSGKLAAQIKHGAPYDIFMSANMKYPHVLYSESLAITKPLVYASGSLALLSVKKQNFNDMIALLNSSTIKRIAVANPRTAPYGAATLEAFKNADTFKDIKHKFIYAESISQTLSYVFTAASIGVVAKSALYSPKMARFKEDQNWKEIDPRLYTPIQQGIVILKKGQNRKEVQTFYDFILSDASRKILQNFGYSLP
ncbi:MAG: molybdate ABC transporter substrate-binding protein [Campylobacterota bacterium]|nr:molybdate ABC transporter substrate-binding protein [Campylobacterota bacterium]